MSELLSDLELDRSTPPADSSGADDSNGKSRPKTHHIEQAIVLMANAVWAVVGLVLWIPQIVRVVITSAIRLIHAALTRQPIDSIRGPIRRVSRFYIDGFLSPSQQKATGSYGSRQLQLGRFLTESLWVVAVWLGVLRLVNQGVFASVWQGIIRFATWTWARATDLARILANHLPESLQAFAGLGTAGNLALAFVLIVFLAAGFILGRRSR